MKNEFILSPNQFFKSVKKELFFRSIIIILGALIGIAIMIFAVHPSKQMLVITFFIFAAFSIFFIIKTYKSMKKAWLDYKLFINNENIICERGDLPKIVLSKEDVIEIKEIINYGVLIETKNKYKGMLVPKNLLDYEECKNILLNW